MRINVTYDNKNCEQAEEAEDIPRGIKLHLTINLFLWSCNYEGNKIEVNSKGWDEITNRYLLTIFKMRWDW